MTAQSRSTQRSNRVADCVLGIADLGLRGGPDLAVDEEDPLAGSVADLEVPANAELALEQDPGPTVRGRGCISHAGNRGRGVAGAHIRPVTLRSPSGHRHPPMALFRE